MMIIFLIKITMNMMWITSYFQDQREVEEKDVNLPFLVLRSGITTLKSVKLFFVLMP